jgi:acetyl esterase/lipase
VSGVRRFLTVMAVLVILHATLTAKANAAERPGARLAGLYSEITSPETKPAGTVLVIHGGGWLLTGESQVRYEAGEAQRFTSYGWRALNVDYRPGKDSLADVVAWFAWAKTRYPNKPVCVFGRSAGGHLALMLAARARPDCVIAHAPVTDLRAVKGTPEAGVLRRDFVEPTFGAELARYSPVERIARPGVPVLLATSAADRYTQCRHITRYQERRPATQVRCLPAGGAAFMHAGVTERSLRAQHRREERLLARVVRARGGRACPPGPGDGGGRIRTCEGRANGFTARPL